MSMVLWIVEEGVDGDETTPDLWALYQFSEDLDRLCADAGVKKLSEFHDNSVMAAEFDQEIPQIFSDASELLTTLSAIQDSVKCGSHAFVADGQDRSQDVDDDIDHAICVVTDSHSKGKRVRLSVIP